MEDLSKYKGKEQGYFKHCLLEAYLERLFMIVGKFHNTICYVDCFAGPWQSNSDDLEDTSIAVSLNIIRKCRDGLKLMDRDVHFRALFVEEKKKSFRVLDSYLNGRRDDGIETQAKHGEFHKLIPEILDWCKTDSFVFFFVDPTGWKDAIELSTLAPLLERPNSELLINFMYDFLSRTAPQEVFRDDMERIFGIVPDTELMEPAEREAHLLSLYRNNLKRVTPAGREKPRTAYVKVLKPTEDRTLYHLVYLTGHPKGIVVFMEASDKLDLVQKKARALAKQDKRVAKTKQFELFSADEHLKDERSETNLDEVKAYWLSHLTTKPKCFGGREFADMLEETDWLPSEFQKAFAELVKEGKVQNLDAKRARPVKAVNFDKNEALVRLQQ